MRKNILFRTFSVLLAVALFAAVSPAASAYTYDGDAAKRYADTYASVSYTHLTLPTNSLV